MGEILAGTNRDPRRKWVVVVGEGRERGAGGGGARNYT